MKTILLVGFGGFIGAVARYKLGGLVLHHTAAFRFPLSTFVVNIVGCLAAGILAGMVIKHDSFSPNARLFIFTGILGGFTTFSAFGLDTFYLLQRHDLKWAALNATLSPLIGILAVWLGAKLVS